MSKKQMLFGFVAILMSGAVAVPATAANGGYSSSRAAPTMYQTNYDYSSGDWSVPSSTPSTSTITTISWSVGYTNPSQGTVQSRLCMEGGSCTTYGGTSGSTSAFSGKNGKTSKFYFQARVNYGSTIVLSTPAYPSGNSTINVNYTY
jgi:hypothetical protein